jgi:medium-chain acyl-[acyl-carrier-protein] hydrolase
MTGLDTRWLRRCGGSRTPKLRLICLPYAGGGASIFRDWRLGAQTEAEVWAIQPPGREDRCREPLVRTSEEMTMRIVSVLPALFDLPYALFGHSMGALLAFEVTRALRAANEPLPVRLLVSAHRAPHLSPWRPAASSLPKPHFLERLVEIAGPSRAAAVQPKLVEAFEPTTRADLALCERYRYRPAVPLAVPMTCFGAVDDPEVRMDELQAWQAHTTAGFEICPFQGGHLFLRDHSAQLLDTITTALMRSAIAG